MTATEHTPDYPPRTPPPPKRPPSPPRPDTLLPGILGQGTPAGPGQALPRSGRRGVTMANRRGSNWVLESSPWAVRKARTVVLGQLGKWDYRPAPDTTATVGDVVALLVEAATADPGSRITVHLSDQGGQVCILALSHAAGPAPEPAGPAAADNGDEDVLHRITAHHAVTGCGTDLGPDGRRTWAVLDL